jgi:cell division transport system ATP-binding protein
MPPSSRSTTVEKNTVPLSPPANAAPAPAASNALITFRNVNKTYVNGSKALIDLNLEIRRGQFLFITGPSGSGKSTLLKLMYGEETATEGAVMVDGFCVGELKGDRLAELRRRIGIVFQDYKLIARRTVAENIAFVLQAQGYSRQEVQRRLTPALKMVGLIHKADSFPDQLSGGEQQRVCIARAIVGTPPILLADEPTGNLDADNSWQVIKILKKLNAIGITVIITTHDESLIRMSGYPVVQLRNGRLYQL